MHIYAQAEIDQTEHSTGNKSTSDLYAEYASIRNRTTELIAPLSTEDCCVHSLPDASPVKWHFGTRSLVFRNFWCLAPYEPAFKLFHPAFAPCSAPISGG